MAKADRGRTPQAPFQPFPALSDEEFAALKASIKAEGRVLHAIIKDEEGRILDGHHRWGAWEELRAEGCTIPEPRIEVVTGYTEARKRDLVLALNLGRRHLGKEQRQYIIAHLRREGWSMRDIAEKARTSKSAVHRAISSGVPLGTPGDGSPPATVRGRDGRRYRARKKKRPMAAPATVLPGGSLAAFLAHTRQEITRRRKENHDERMRRNWNPEAI